MQVKSSLPTVAFGDVNDYINRAISLSKKLIHWLPECSGYDRVRTRTLWMMML